MVVFDLICNSLKYILTRKLLDFLALNKLYDSERSMKSVKESTLASSCVNYCLFAGTVDS